MNAARTIEVLLVESRPGVGSKEVAALRAAGHRVRRCFDEQAGASPALCVGVTTGTCPLDEPIDVALVVRDAPDVAPTYANAGVICALRAGLPLVESGPTIGDPYRDVLDRRANGDVVAACEAAADHAFQPLAERILATVTRTLGAAGVRAEQVSCEVQASGRDLDVVFKGPAIPADVVQALSVRAYDAARTHPRTFGHVGIRYQAAL